jgi:hypothetical protein
MKTNRIIFFTEDQFTERNSERFGVQLLMNRGFQVEVWECSPFLRPALFDASSSSDTFPFSGYKLFHSKKSLLKAIDDLTAHDVILTYLSNSQIKTHRIYTSISQKCIPWGSVLDGQIPIPSELKGFWSRATRLLENPASLISFFLKKLPGGWQKLRPFQFLLVGGSGPYLSAFPGLIDSQTDILNIHSFDYDLYLKKKEVKSSFNSEYVVFLDHCGPYHPDRKAFKTLYPCSPEEYYGNLNEIFNLIEDKFSYKVVIAAHPKSNYPEMPDLFKGRQVICGETHDLVKGAKFVVASASTAVHFAVIFKKPIVFLALNPDRNNELDLKIKHLASELGKSPIHWNGKSSVDFETQLEINGEKYSEFLDFYIKTPDSPERFSWDIFADYLDSV